LAVGYSHGYPFSAWRDAEVLILGKRYKLAGRISMDYMAVHFKDDTLPRDEEVTLLGQSGEDSIGAEEIAQWAGTIPYEIVTRLSGNLPRVYL
jgi:alanine racemase